MAGELTAMGGQRAIAQQFLQLASDSDNAVFMIEQGEAALSGVVLYLGLDDAEVVSIASQTIMLLSSPVATRTKLLAIPNLVTALEKVYGSDNASAKKFATTALTNLGKLEAAPVAKAVPSKAVPSWKQQTATTTLKIAEIADDTARPRIERCLIAVPGVVSVTIDQRRCHAIVLSKGRDDIVEAIVAAMAVSSFKIAVVKKRGDEGPAPLGERDANAAPTAAAAQKPIASASFGGYLDDSESDSEEDDGHITSYGFSSLDERLQAAQRKRDEEQGKVGRFFGKIGRGVGKVGRFSGLF